VSWSPSPTTAALELREVGHDYPSRDGTVPALDGITLSLDQGQHLAVVGPSGSGKSTLLRLIAGFPATHPGHAHRPRHTRDRPRA